MSLKSPVVSPLGPGTRRAFGNVRRGRGAALLVVASLCGSGCSAAGGGGDGGGSSSEGIPVGGTSLPKDQPINELTFPDYQVLCDEQVDLLEAFLGSEEGYCQVLGLSNSFGDTAEALSYSCYQAMNECLQMGGGQLEMFIKERRDECAVSPRQGVLQGFDDCAEPVGRLSACSEDTANLQWAWADHTCDEWTPELRQAPTGGEAPSCKQLATDCQAVAAPVPNAEFLGSCRRTLADGQLCLEVSCTDCPAGLKSDLKSSVCGIDVASGSTSSGEISEMGCADTATSVGSCRQDGELMVGGTTSTLHITTFMWPTDPTTVDLQADCAEAGGIYSAP